MNNRNFEFETRLLSTYSGEKYKRFGLNKNKGVFAPLYMIHSNDSVGIGDIMDIRHLIDWCHSVDLSVVQLLPINECNVSPYSPFSFYAIDPIYISLKNLKDSPSVDDEVIKDLQKKFSTKSSMVNYEVREAKVSALYEIFLKIDNVKSGAFKEFISQNVHWLPDYAIFQAIKKVVSPFTWDTWPEKYRSKDPIAIAKFYRENESLITFLMWIQWQIFEQFSFIKKYATSKKISLFGDLIYIVGRDSADVWSDRESYHLHLVPGIPPEASFPKGMRWESQPVYNWDKLLQSNYEIYRRRFIYFENFFHIVRIDSAASLFRMWEIPMEADRDALGLPGKYYPENFEECRNRGIHAFKTFIDATDMIICSEDLSPMSWEFDNDVRDLGVPLIQFQRWLKDWETSHDFIHPSNMDPVSAITLSNQDTSSFAEWWEYEAGTIPEALFEWLCQLNPTIDKEKARNKLFDLSFSEPGKLKWNSNINSAECIDSILGIERVHSGGFIRDFLNTSFEKEKLWKIINKDNDAPLPEKSDKDLVGGAIRSLFSANSAFPLVSIVDVSYALGIINGDSRNFKINKPGSSSDDNWKQRLPVPLETYLEAQTIECMKEISKN